MSDILEERVIAYVDGELDGEAHLSFELRLASESELAERVAAHRWMARQVTAAYGPPPQADDDYALIARLGLGDCRVVALADHRPFVDRRPQAKVAALIAMAASLVLAIIAGSTALTSTSSFVRVPEGSRIASGVLAAGLSDQLAGEQGRVRIGLSFRSEKGVCRTFSTDQGGSGIGCREGDHWLVPMMTTNHARKGGDASTDYRLAGGDIPATVMAEVDRRIRGEPLSPADEKLLRRRHWR